MQYLEVRNLGDPGQQMNSFKGFGGLPTAFGKGKGSAKGTGSGSFRTDRRPLLTL